MESRTACTLVNTSVLLSLKGCDGSSGFQESSILHLLLRCLPALSVKWQMVLTLLAWVFPLLHTESCGIRLSFWRVR